jgi:hypothetical protein
MDGCRGSWSRRQSFKLNLFIYLLTDCSGCLTLLEVASGDVFFHA